MTDPTFKSNTRFFFVLSLVYLLIVILGFAPTFYLRAFVDFENHVNGGLPVGLIFHGVIMTCWYGLFAFQSFLIRRGDILLHRRLGVVGIALASLVVITSIITNVGIASKVIDDGRAEFVFVANFASLVLFSVFFSAAIAFRKKPDSHKRLMTCASLFVIAPAVAPSRWLGATIQELVAVPVFPLVTLGVLVALAIYDFRTRGRIHWATTCGFASFVIIAVNIEVVIRAGLAAPFVEWLS